MYGQRQDPEGGWHRVFGRQQYAFRFPKMTRLINTFNIELRETEVFVVRLLAEKFEPRVVEVILASKLYLNLSYEDIALGLTRGFSYLLRGYRYVWMLPFKKRHVEIVWYRSQLAQTESLRRIAGKDRQEENFSRFLMLFMKCVESGRADERLGLDPRSCGNGTSAANLVEEVMRLFLGKVASKDMFEALMAL